MKQLLAVFFALVLAPTFNTYAWIGGPFSNNTYFGENGDDGTYEAVAFPLNGFNGIGIYRWAVGNQFTGVAPASLTTVNTDNFGDYIIGTTGNVQFAGTGLTNHSWYIEGTGYRGFSEGVVNSGLGVISVVGQAEAGGGSADIVTSGFTADFTTAGNGLPIRRFEGFGTANSSVAAIGQFTIFAFGSKVSDSISIFGI